MASETTNYGTLNDDSEEQSSVVVYKRRWYILVIQGLLGVVQNCMWNTWGPISDSAELVYGWTDAQIGNLALVGNVVYGIVAFPVCYIIDVYGLRTGALFSASLMVIGSGVRCIPGSVVNLYWTAMVGAVLSGAAGVVAFAGPPLVSSVWFPAHQRATATAIINLFNYAGVACAFLIGNFVVHYRDLNSTQSTLEVVANNSHSEEIISVQRKEIEDLLYIEFGFIGLLFLLILVYFPAKPPTPPSVSASTGRLNYRQGLLKLIRLKQLWLVALAYSIPTGVLGVWPTVITIQFSDEGVSQTQAGWLGCCLSLGGAIAGVGVSRFSDIFSKHMKTTLLVLYSLATGALVWLVLLCEKYISFSIVSLYIAVILTSIFVNGSVPLFYEISCELSYPQPEGVVGGFLTSINVLFGVLFLMVLNIPHLGTSWMNWSVLGSVIVSIPLLLGVKETYGRLNLDDEQNKANESQIKAGFE